MSALPAETVDAKTNSEDSPDAVREKRLHLLGACSVPACFDATLVSLATAARSPLPLSSAKKHHTLFAAVSARFATAVRRH